MKFARKPWAAILKNLHAVFMLFSSFGANSNCLSLNRALICRPISTHGFTFLKQPGKGNFYVCKWNWNHFPANIPTHIVFCIQDGSHIWMFLLYWSYTQLEWTGNLPLCKNIALTPVLKASVKSRQFSKLLLVFNEFKMHS